MAPICFTVYCCTMKTILIAGILGTVILMSGCMEPDYNHRYSHSNYGYYNNGHNGGYRDGYYREGYNSPYYHTRNVDRVIVY